MKITFICITFALMPLLLIAQECQIKYDGLYVTEKAADEHGNLRYLRFYKDGTVISVYSEETVDVVAQWFVKEREELSTGKYNINKCDIRFTTKNKTGKYKYNGKVSGDKLALIKQLSGGSAQKINYKFIIADVKN